MAMKDALASFFHLFTSEKSLYIGNLQHADICIGGKHYKVMGKILNARYTGHVNECFRLSIEDDSENEKSLVLRRMLRDFVAAHPQCKQLLKREWELFQQLKMAECPYLVKLIDYIEEEDSLISELIAGLPLDLFVKQEPEYYFKRKTTLKMLKQLIEAVGFLHSKGVCHLDITPSCIFVKADPDHDIVLLNNGLAAATYDKLPLGKIIDTNIPPELMRGEAYDQRTDIWEIGKIIRMIIDVRKKDPTRASNHLKLIAAKCMKAKKEDRYNNVKEILKDLETWEHLYDRFPEKKSEKI